MKSDQETSYCKPDGTHHLACDCREDHFLRVEKARNDYREALSTLTIRMNKVTSHHRHQKRVPKDLLDALCNEQLDAEAMLKKWEAK